MTTRQIEKEQAMANVKFEAAKKMAEILEAAKAEYKKAGGEDWDSELEDIQRMVFEDE